MRDERLIRKTREAIVERIEAEGAVHAGSLDDELRRMLRRSRGGFQHISGPLAHVLADVALKMRKHDV